MNTPWIKAQGVLAPEAGGDAPHSAPMLDAFLAAHTPASAAYYIAQGVAAFCTGSVTAAQGGAPVFTPPLAEVQTMLELRIFGADAELWLHRTTLDAPFAWRMADDAVLSANVAQAPSVFLQNPNHYRLPQVQYCSIDHTRTAQPPQQDENGRQLFHFIGGGQYALPAPDGCDCIALVQYLSYDEASGQALPMDYRFCGFTTAGNAPKPL